MLGLHKNLQQETRKLVACEPQTKRFAPFIGMFCFFFFLFLCVPGIHRESVQGVL